MIVYKSMMTGSMEKRKQPYPFRTDFNPKSLIIVSISAVVLLLALLSA